MLILKVINNIIDRCFFTITFIVGVQMPEFIKQYQLRLSGQMEESLMQLAQFKDIASQHFDGDIKVMIQRYKENSEASIINTGEAIEALTFRSEYLTTHLAQISTDSYLTNIMQFLRYIDLQIAAQTAQSFTLAIPLELNALATGGVIAISALVIKEVTYAIVCRLFKKPNNTFTANSH